MLPLAQRPDTTSPSCKIWWKWKWWWKRRSGGPAGRNSQPPRARTWCPRCRETCPRTWNRSRREFALGVFPKPKRHQKAAKEQKRRSQQQRRRRVTCTFLVVVIVALFALYNFSRSLWSKTYPLATKENITHHSFAPLTSLALLDDRNNFPESAKKSFLSERRESKGEGGEKLCRSQKKFYVGSLERRVRSSYGKMRALILLAG